MSKPGSTPVWRLRSQADRRFRAGHPWIYSNELQESPKGIEPGALVEVQDAGGRFLARGYGNPSSLIAFRALSRDPGKMDVISEAGLYPLIAEAGQARIALGLRDFSYRLCFGEADGLPGLVIDRFVVEAGHPLHASPSEAQARPAARATGMADEKDRSQVFVLQLHTAGMDRMRGILPSLLERYAREHTDIPWERTALVLRNDLSVRKLEGLLEEPPCILKEAPGLVPEEARVLLRPAFGSPFEGEPLALAADLVRGQKTGFFLDQSANIELAARRLAHLSPARPGQPLRILDLFCYVGQWSSQLARVYARRGLQVEVVAIDASASALERARRNIEGQGAKCKAIKMDLMRNLQSVPELAGGFDLVICDPPALIQGRKDIPAGTHAYLQLNTQVFGLVRPGGAVVSCSCSALLEEEAFLKSLSKAAYRNRAQVRWVARGAQAPDHPMRLEFPEGRYLKAWMGLVATKGQGEENAND